MKKTKDLAEIAKINAQMTDEEKKIKEVIYEARAIIL